MIIYKITNLINNKIYIGQDSHNNPKYYGSGKILKQAIQKYGKESFVKEILEHCDTIEQLNEREIFWIKELNSQIPNGYNIAEGGQGGDTFTINPNKEEIRNKNRLHQKNRKIVYLYDKNMNLISEYSSISLAAKENNISKGTLVEILNNKQKNINDKIWKISDDFLNIHGNRFKKTHKQESIEKMKKAKLGKKLSDEHKRNISLVTKGENNPMFNKNQTVETRNKISIANGHSVFQFDLNYNFISEYKSIRYAEKITGIKRAIITKCCENNCSYNNFIWKYKEI